MHKQIQIYVLLGGPECVCVCVNKGSVTLQEKSCSVTVVMGVFKMREETRI